MLVRSVATSPWSATGRASNARPAADHGEVATLRTSIPLEAFQLRGERFSARDADDGRLGIARSDGWAVRQSSRLGAGSDRLGDRGVASHPAVQNIKIAAHVADAGDAAHGIGRLLRDLRADNRQSIG